VLPKPQLEKEKLAADKAIMEVRAKRAATPFLMVATTVADQFEKFASPEHLLVVSTLTLQAVSTSPCHGFGLKVYSHGHHGGAR